MSPHWPAVMSIQSTRAQVADPSPPRPRRRRQALRIREPSSQAIRPRILRRVPITPRAHRAERSRVGVLFGRKMRKGMANSWYYSPLRTRYPRVWLWRIAPGKSLSVSTTDPAPTVTVRPSVSRARGRRIRVPVFLSWVVPRSIAFLIRIGVTGRSI